MYEIKFPPNVQWEVTSLCNHKCIHCYNFWRTDEVKVIENVHSEEEYLRFAKAIAKNKPVSVVITGGEPLIVFEKIKPSIEYLKSKNIVVSFNSNATLVTEEIAKYCGERNISFFVSFPCSRANVCDLITGAKGSFENINKGIKILDKYGVKYALNMVVSHLNLDYIYETAEYVKSVLHKDNFFITKSSRPIYSSSAFDKNLLSLSDVRAMIKTAVKIKKDVGINIESACTYPLCMYEDEESYETFAFKKVCVAGKVFYAVGFDGEVRACSRDITSYGNILKDEFVVIWDKMRSWRDGSFIPEECNDCKSKMQCIGGCRIDGFQYTGRHNSLDTSTDLANKDIKFIPKDNKSYENIKCDKLFKINPQVNFIKDNTAYRASCDKRFIYLKQNIYEFINKNVEFTVEDVAKWFSISDMDAKKVIFMLLYNRVVV